MTQQQSEQLENQGSTPEEGTSVWFKRIMGALFYGGLTIYLLASVDHVAWFFHLYEPKGSQGWWALASSYGKAGALDLAVFFLAYVAATGKTADKWVTWMFTALLSAISLYANYIYAMYYNPQQQANVWNIELVFGVTTGWLSPLIASSYPIFAMIFLYLIERVISQKVESIEQMRARLEQERDRKALLNEIKAESKRDLFGALSTGLNQAKQLAELATRKEDKTEEYILQAVTFLQDSPDLQQPENKKRAIGLLARLLKVGKKDAELHLVKALARIAKSTQPGALLEPLPDAENGDNSVDIQVIIDSVTREDTSPALIQLGMIEQRMYDALCDDRKTFRELVQLAQQEPLSAFTSRLQSRFSQYAMYITEARVGNVLAYLRQEHPALFSSGEEEDYQGDNGKNRDVEIALITGKSLENAEGVTGKNSDLENGNENPSDGEIPGLVLLPGTGVNNAAPIDLETRRKPVSFAEAAKVLNVAEKTVKNYLRDGKLSSPDGNEKAVTIASLRKLLIARQSAQRNGTG